MNDSCVTCRKCLNKWLTTLSRSKHREVDVQLIEWLLRFFAWIARRPKLKIWVIEDDPDRNPGGLVFEVENISHSKTSLAPIVKSRFWFPKRGEYHKGRTIYDVRELDRDFRP